MTTTWNDSRFGPGSYEHAAQEDRSAPRVRVHIEASVRPAGMRPFATILRDVSACGFTATAADRLESHSLCWLALPGQPVIEAEVIWWDKGLFGAAFSHLIDPAQFDMVLAQSAKGEDTAG